MRPTRRFVLASAIVGGGILLAWIAGARALNAIVAPIIALALLSVTVVHWTGLPSIERQPVDPGFPGECRTVRATVSGANPAGVVVSDTVGSGLESLEDARAVIDGEGTVEHRVRLSQRGIHSVGPLQTRVRDVFGFVERGGTDGQRSDVVVFPTPRSMPPSVRGQLDAISHDDASATDEEFDHLRAHEPGESIDRIDWKATAKRPDHEFVVAEYRSKAPRQAIMVEGTSVPGRADEMVETVAGVVTYLLGAQSGVEVGVSVPAGTIAPGSGEDHRLAILRLLAETADGTASESGEVRVTASEEETTVTIEDDQIVLEEAHGD